MLLGTRASTPTADGAGGALEGAGSAGAHKMRAGGYKRTGELPSVPKIPSVPKPRGEQRFFIRYLAPPDIPQTAHKFSKLQYNDPCWEGTFLVTC